MRFASILSSPERRQKTLSVLGVAALAAWLVWWVLGLAHDKLFGIDHSWFRIPALGADFYTESDLFTRVWLKGDDPYLNEDRLFHYPPVVLRLFSWVGFFEPRVALWIWIGALAVITVASTLVACRSRVALGIPKVPAAQALPLVLWNSAVIFEMERANWDFVSFAAVLVALPLLRPRRAPLDFLAGCLLAVCPWVKIYPGFLGIGLLALRRWYALAGFVVAGAGILLGMWAETLRAVHIVKLAMEIVRRMGWLGGIYPPWVHSLSMAWLRILDITIGRPKGERIVGYTAWAFAAAVVVPLLAWVGLRLCRSQGRDRLVYPFLLWVLAVASFVPDIANDYSLAFLPVAALAVSSFRDPPLVRVGLVLLALWWQPFWLPIPGPVMLVVKLVGVIAVGRSITERAKELDVQPA